MARVLGLGSCNKGDEVHGKDFIVASAKVDMEGKAAEGEKVLLVVDYTTNWYVQFKGIKTATGERIRVEQTEWKDIHVEASAEEGCIVHLKASDNPLPFSSMKEDRIIKPDFILVRNFPGDIHDNSFRNIIVGLLFADVPSVNSIESIYRCMDRPLAYAEMLKIQKRLGKEGFPLIPMTYYPNIKSSTQRLIQPSFPAVIKVASTHAGYGKIQAQDKGSLQDVACILALHNDYYTAEPFIEHEYEFRIQKIGDHYRAFRRTSTTSWKNNWGNLTFVDHEMKEEYKVWADEVAKMFGGLDIHALDVLHTKEGKDYIIEVNDTAPGLMYEHEEEDLKRIRDLVVAKLNQHYYPDHKAV